MPVTMACGEMVDVSPVAATAYATVRTSHEL